jgi:hypothetical protein
VPGQRRYQVSLRRRGWLGQASRPFDSGADDLGKL